MSRKPAESQNISFELQKRVIALIADEDCDGKECSNSEFAKRVGVNKNVISNITNYAIIPNVASLTKIANYVKVSIEYLMGKTDNDKFEAAEHPVTFHERLLQLKQEKGLKFADITNMCNFPRNSVHVWLKRKNLPSIDYLFQLAKALDVSADYLLGRTDDRN